jgi:predicted amidohydrolase
VFGQRGAVIASYRKIHLFDVTLPHGQVYAESASTRAGAQAVTFDGNGVRVGLAICYDLRFSALFDALATAGAELLSVTAAFTEATGMAHWEVLLRARAIEHGAYVAAAAQWGSHPGGRRTFGHAMIVDPWGCIVAQHGDGDGIAVATLDLAYLNEVRSRLPCAQHRRPVRPAGK